VQKLESKLLPLDISASACKKCGDAYYILKLKKKRYRHEKVP
jgi:hypothetical protein